MHTGWPRLIQGLTMVALASLCGLDTSMVHATLRDRRVRFLAHKRSAKSRVGSHVGIKKVKKIGYSLGRKEARSLRYPITPSVRQGIEVPATPSATPSADKILVMAKETVTLPLVSNPEPPKIRVETQTIPNSVLNIPKHEVKATDPKASDLSVEFKAIREALPVKLKKIPVEKVPVEEKRKPEIVLETDQPPPKKEAAHEEARPRRKVNYIHEGKEYKTQSDYRNAKYFDPFVVVDKK